MQGKVERGGARLLAAFGLAIFTSAFLLFSIQPMFTKMVLPQLGGSPAVWSIAMVFFQALLLAGYLYAHLSTRYLPLKLAAIIHITLMALAFLALPIAVNAGAGEPPASGQEAWLIGVFLASVGLPFFAVAGNGPLLQAWFSRSSHAQADDPYFLYGASNLGSFAALLLYPLAIEPVLRLNMQSFYWSCGFAALIGMIAIAALMLRPGTASKRMTPLSPKPTSTAIAQWIALSFIPSGLLVAVTAHISTDIAAAPFLWVIPLALYLLTFVLIFRETPLVPMKWVQGAMPLLACGLLLLDVLGTRFFVAAILIHTGFFVAATLVCHHQLYASRPAAGHLTSFYLWMSFGGVLGGAFCGLVAPNIFNRILEYPILVVLAVFVLPGALPQTRAAFLRRGLPVIMIGVALYLALLALSGGATRDPGAHVKAIYIIAIAAAAFILARPWAMALSLPFLFMGMDAFQHMQVRTSERSFFGVHKVDIVENGQFRILAHGSTIHGAIRIRNPDGTPVSGRPKPLSYYHPDGPMAEVLAKMPPRPRRSIGVVGLGAGAYVCNGTPGDQWTLFEIDRTVVTIASDPQRFRFLSECAPDARMVLGDARLTLAKEKPAAFDLLMIDAFSSDAIPVHLMTREAMALYFETLAPGGIVMIHISNRHLALMPVIGAIAAEMKLVALYRGDTRTGNSLEDVTSSDVVVLARDALTLAPLGATGEWQPATGPADAIWTDDFSNILGALWRRYRYGPSGMPAQAK